MKEVIEALEKEWNAHEVDALLLEAEMLLPPFKGLGAVLVPVKASINLLVRMIKTAPNEEVAEFIRTKILEAIAPK